MNTLKKFYLHTSSLMPGFFFIFGAVFTAGCPGPEEPMPMPSPSPSNLPVARALMARTPLQALAECDFNVGIRVDLGLESNGNDALDSDEILTTLFVCAPSSAPESGVVPLVDVLEIPVGDVNCAQGGVAVRYGYDGIGSRVAPDGIFGPEEILGGVSACSGVPNPMDMKSINVVSYIDPSAGERCAWGGYRHRFGTDSNRDGVLQTSEQTFDVSNCFSAEIFPSVMRVVTVPRGPTCIGGGVKIQWGTDFNFNSVLDDAEVNAERTMLTCVPCTPAESPACWTGRFSNLGSLEQVFSNRALDVKIGEYNGDGRKDIYMLADNGLTIFFNVNNYDDIISSYSSVFYDLRASNSSRLAVGDINGDGVSDVIVTGLIDEVQVHLAMGFIDPRSGPRLGSWVRIDSAPLVREVYLEDMNGDRRKDIVLATGSGYRIHYSNDVYVFDYRVMDSGFGFTRSIAFADLNADGVRDMILCGEPDALKAYLGNTWGRSYYEAFTIPSGQPCTGAVAADWNGDDLVDLAWTSGNSPTDSRLRLALSVASGIAGFTFSDAPVLDYILGHRIYGPPTLGHFNGDGILDLLVTINTGSSSGGWRTLLFEPDLRSVTVGNISNPLFDSTTSVAMGDINGDGNPDFVAAQNVATGAVNIYVSRY